MGYPNPCNKYVLFHEEVCKSVKDGWVAKGLPQHPVYSCSCYHCLERNRFVYTFETSESIAFIHQRMIYIMIIVLKIFRCCPWWKSPSSCSLRKRWIVLFYVCVHQWNGWGLWRSSTARMDEPYSRLQGFLKFYNTYMCIYIHIISFVYNHLVKLFFLHVDTRPCWLQSYWIREAERNHQEWLRVLCGTSLEKRKSKVLLKSCRN